MSVFRIVNKNRIVGYSMTIYSIHTFCTLAIYTQQKHLRSEITPKYVGLFGRFIGMKPFFSRFSVGIHMSI